jgi:hypothetical protein
MAAVVSPLRAFNIAVRTAHLGIAGVLLGGHVFKVAASHLLPFLYFVIVTGAALSVIELYPDWRGLFELRSLILGAKLLMLAAIPWFWDYRVAILVFVLVLASVGSHMPRRLRHLSLLESRTPQRAIPHKTLKCEIIHSCLYLLAIDWLALLKKFISEISWRAWSSRLATTWSKALSLVPALRSSDSGKVIPSGWLLSQLK